MKVIGVLGGMSAASTALYCTELNRLVAARLGGLHSADLLIRSVDFAPIAALQAKGDWDDLANQLADEAARLRAGGAELLLLATNTMHIAADRIAAGFGGPMVHIADATARAINAEGHRRPGLMATAFTMEKPFYLDRLRLAGLDPLVPQAEDRALTHKVIYDELCKGVVCEASRARYEAIAARLVLAGADCLILGCTEVGMLLSSGNVSVPVFDTVALHCQAAIELAFAAG
jgi:aspartate racemase